MTFASWTPRKSWGLALVMVLALVGVAADLVSKHYVFRTLGPPPGRVYWLWEDYVGFETSVNTGALFGMGQGRVTWFAAISIAAVMGILSWLMWGEATRDLGLCVILGIVLGGIVGNLYDRLGCWGQQGVRDWILLKYGDFVWPNFNIADSLLVCGAGLMAVHALRSNSAAPPSISSPADRPNSSRRGSETRSSSPASADAGQGSA